MWSAPGRWPRLVGLPGPHVDRSRPRRARVIASASASGDRGAPGPEPAGHTRQPELASDDREQQARARTCQRILASGQGDRAFALRYARRSETPCSTCSRIRDQFPITRQRFQVLGSAEPRPLIYMDHGASTHPPTPVLETYKDFLESSYANVHRGRHYLSEMATDRFEHVSEDIFRFIQRQPLTATP